jgi:hypothetical protein
MSKTEDIKFGQHEWETATHLAVCLLEALGPQKQGCCEECQPPRVLLPNYPMKYELAMALRRLATSELD